MTEAGQVYLHAAGSGRPLVLLHGWSMTGQVFSGLQQALPGVQSLAVDLPGHGRSPAPESFDLEGLGEPIVELFERRDLRRAVLLGWSLGGMLALALEPRLRPRLEQLVLVGTTPRFVAGPDWPHGLPATRLKVMLRDLQRHYLKTMEDFFRLMFAPGELDPSGIRTIARQVTGAELLPEPSTATAGLELLQQLDLRPQLEATATPALVMHGVQDAIIPIGAGRELASRLPQAQLELFPGCGHAPFLTRPEAFAQVLRRHLA